LIAGWKKKDGASPEERLKGLNRFVDAPWIAVALLRDWFCPDRKKFHFCF